MNNNTCLAGAGGPHPTWYEMEDLLPVVAKLAEKYIRCESTSVTYEKAEQLMGAVLYCIGELNNDNILEQRERMSAQQAYELGYKCVIKKVKSALDRYNDLSREFKSYGNHCLHDTIIKGMPEFFKWYDAEFEPQNTILTLDYPILKDLSAYSGIDRIYEYINCIHIEQVFLGQFSEAAMRNILKQYHCQYQELVENICEIAYMAVLRHSFMENSLAETDLNEIQAKQLQKAFVQTDKEYIKDYLLKTTKRFVEKYYKGDEGVLNYLTLSLDDIIVRLKMTTNKNRIT